MHTTLETDLPARLSATLDEAGLNMCRELESLLSQGGFAADGAADRIWDIERLLSASLVARGKTRVRPTSGT